MLVENGLNGLDYLLMENMINYHHFLKDFFKQINYK
jgi:hypothetical protein